NKLKKNIEIDDEVEQEIAELWNQFPNAKSYINETWIQYKENWLTPYVNNNINLNIRSSQHVKSLHSKLKGIENHIIPVDRLLSIINKTDISLEKVYLICSKFAFESFLKQQADLAVSGIYEVLVYEGGTFDVIQIDSLKQLKYVVQLEEPKLGTSQEYWFYVPECAQLVSDTYNMPVIVFGANPNTSLLFLPFEQKPGLHRKPIVLQ
ncbi:31900_t:CDS:2, partial [Gigaspora margarita]